MINGKVERFTKQLKLYGTGIADPPWPEKGGGKIKRGADKHYPLMKVKDIAALEVRGQHVSKLFAPNAHLYMWVTNNFLFKSQEVWEAWGFQYVTVITWGKAFIKTIEVPHRGHVELEPVIQVQTGLGQYYRGGSEQLLFLKRGQPPYRKDPVTGKRAQGQTLILAPRDEHSAKPEKVRADVERVSAGPYVELFARERVKNWDAFGNQVKGSI